jgi:hypothetical protein
LLECPGHAQEDVLLVPVGDDLEADRKPVVAQAGGDGARGVPGQVERIAEGDRVDR